MENYSLSDLATAAGNDGAFGGEMGFFWIFALLLLPMLSGGGLWGNNAASTADIQRAVDLNSIQTGQANISSDIQRGIYEINGATKDAAYNNLSEIRDVGSAVATSGANIINNLTSMQAQMQNCCCETKQTIMENRYLDSQNAAAIQANDTANTQKVLDKLANMELANEQRYSQQLAQKVATLENQMAINAATAGVVRYPTATTYSSGSNPFCGCSCGTI